MEMTDFGRLAEVERLVRRMQSICIRGTFVRDDGYYFTNELSKALGLEYDR